jgi:hypothetical protein
LARAACCFAFFSLWRRLISSSLSGGVSLMLRP